MNGEANEPESEERLRAALERLSDGEGLAEAERAISRVAPELRVALADALANGGWFGQSHDAETLKAATIPDEELRLEAVRAQPTATPTIIPMLVSSVKRALRAELDGPERESELGGS